ncbi:MAG: hypothetical protein Q4C85_10170 [Actinomyces sp.]|uniref:hypothetical protein n=1 Tax=Actinomyces sp. TaxID=29317 RepID=UPI0026DC1530|nr:hypothetical protein [Actinomyces sp.]MDO4244102.1 hypothetical protein [Actinomyces sp.]
MPVAIAMIAAAVLTLLALAGCAPGGGTERPIESTSGPISGTVVGRTVSTWRQSADEELDASQLPLGTRLLGTETAWQEWLAALPAPVSAAVTAETPPTDFSTHLLVVDAAVVCREESRLTSPAPRELQVLATAPAEEVLCTWSPVELVVFSVGLDELGVASAEEVTVRDRVVVTEQG